MPSELNKNGKNDKEDMLEVLMGGCHMSRQELKLVRLTFHFDEGMFMSCTMNLLKKSVQVEKY